MESKRQRFNLETLMDKDRKLILVSIQIAYQLRENVYLMSKYPEGNHL